MKPAPCEELERAFVSHASLDDIWHLLRRLKDGGMGKDEMVSVLTALRAKAPNEDVEDRILEAMDFVVGFCSPQSKVFPD